VWDVPAVVVVVVGADSDEGDEVEVDGGERGFAMVRGTGEEPVRSKGVD